MRQGDMQNPPNHFTKARGFREAASLVIRSHLDYRQRSVSTELHRWETSAVFLDVPRPSTHWIETHVPMGQSYEGVAFQK